MLHRTWLTLALFCAASEAEAAPCTPAIHGAELPEAWRQAVDAVNGELAMRTDIERCIDIEVRVDPDHGHARIVITLGERRAVRAVADPVDLRPTVLALLLEPRPPPAEVTEPETIVDAGAAPVEPEAARARDPIEHDLASQVIVTDRAAPSIAVDVGIAIGAVWTDGEAHPSVAAAIRESRGTWSARVFGRLATSSGSGSMGASGISGSPATTSASDVSVGPTSSREVGAELGHRFELGCAALILSTGPSLVMLEKIEASAVAKTRAVRAGGSVRLEPASIRHAGLYVAVDASVNLGQLPDAGATTTGLPTWSMGATFGGELRAWP